ncbi:MAG: hypothetical protein NT166_20560 [Candidatus Aminicenantes bacterium]|nr:hypothetical protein [Candidatus Aminicenantes bacterium]
MDTETIRVGYPWQGWTKEMIDGWHDAFTTNKSVVELDMSQLSLITLFDWVTITAMIERVLTNPNVKSFKIDTKGSDPSNFIPLNDFIRIKKNEPTSRFYPQSEIGFSERVYKAVRFTESLGTTDVLSRGREEEEKISYPEIIIDDIKKSQFYTGKIGELKALLGLTRIHTKEDCRQFIDARTIQNWVKTMGTRFPDSPIFESEEVWRVLCHEFAVNIFEHAGAPGFISMRVISPTDANENVYPWCKQTFSSPEIKRLFSTHDNQFLELCIGDAGKGFIETLKQSYMNRLGQNNCDSIEIKNEDILAFAFDELGTSKDDNDDWVTERHALNRILNITAKYGGVLTVRSGGVELVYSSDGNMFQKNRTGFGYIPTQETQLGGIIPGAQLQILLPLIPSISRGIHQRRSILDSALPSTFHTDSLHVRGHLVPLLEKLDQKEPCVGKEDQHRFRKACETLSKELITKRSSSDPLILDFSQLDWTAGQFETLLFFLQNILQFRPVLLVEIDAKLAHDVIELESISAPTTLDKDLITQRSVTGELYFGEVSEEKYLETYNRIHATVMGIDRDGRYYIFGLRNHAYEAPLLSLIETPKTIEELCNETIWEEQLKESTLKSILNHINPMFQQDNKGQWNTVWNAFGLSIEVKRVMSSHFDDVAKRCGAWRGQPYEKKAAKFNLPWQKEWCSNFLESSLILSRERHADEVAQRLIYRLQKGLEIRGKSLADVKVLASMQAPAMLLASYIHRWWPSPFERPAVSDLGYYVMLGHPRDLPTIVKTGGILIVQDILATGKISGKLIEILRRQKLEILGVLSFIKMEKNLPKTTVTSIGFGWNPLPGESHEGFIPRHAMIQVKRPTKCPPPQPDEKDENTYWIEPRTLQPIRYTFLRRQFKRGQDPDLDRRNKYLERFDNCNDECLFASGHYVYGNRHFSISVDVPTVLTGEIGDEIALWLADICENFPGRKRGEWESEDGSQLEGDITAVLMPLHSQVHYIWPKVEKILAQRGRRQPTWLLDATLFIGIGPSYQIPQQLQYQIKTAVEEAIQAQQNKQKVIKNPLRILILGDVTVTARTVQTILVAISRTVKNEFSNHGIKTGIHTYPNLIEWIRHFCILNQMAFADHFLWKNFKSVGNMNFKFVFEEYAPFMGVPVYTDSDCPICKDRDRLKRLITICEQYGIESARLWVEDRLIELQPVAIDSPGFSRPSSIKLEKGIDVLLKPKKGETDISGQYFQVHADTAIWRFHELMYYSYPPADVLLSLRQAWGTDEDGVEVKKEYERFRWAVLEWCLKNWKRLEANATVEVFIDEIKREIENNTSLIQPILEACSQHFEDPDVIRFIAFCIDRLVKLESKGATSDEGAEPEQNRQTINLYTALALFWLNIPRDEWDILVYDSADSENKMKLMEYMDKATNKIAPHKHSFGRNLYLQLIRPQRHMDPQWALNIIAESLLRGRDPNGKINDQHKLLPASIAEILMGGSVEKERHLLFTSISLFLYALDDISNYGCQLSRDADHVKTLLKDVLKWLKKRGKSNNLDRPPDSLKKLQDALEFESPFMTEFNQTFHEDVESFRNSLEEELKRKGTDLLIFDYKPAEDTRECRVLILGHRLIMCLSNLTIDPIKKFEAKHKSRIEVSRMPASEKKEKICFKLLTNFASLEETNNKTRAGQNMKVDMHTLEAFGAEFAEEWKSPTPDEQKEGFTASYNILVPSGFMPRRP